MLGLGQACWNREAWVRQALSQFFEAAGRVVYQETMANVLFAVPVLLRKLEVAGNHSLAAGPGLHRLDIPCHIRFAYAEQAVGREATC